jgi:aminopeptidase N
MNIKCRLIAVMLTAMWFSARGTNTDTRSDSIHIIHTDLSLDVSHFDTKILFAKASITFQSKVNGTDHIRLDMLRLTVDSVRAGQRALKYRYNDTMIDVSLNTKIEAGEKYTITIFYHGRPVQLPGDFGGFFWDDLYAFNIGISFLSEPHNYAKVWFPCFDDFVERSTFHFAVTTDPTRRAMCNGHQDSVGRDAKGNKIWYWTMPDQIPPYLASLSVSDYAVIEDTFHSVRGVLPIWLAARAADTAKLKKSFVHLKKALSIFESRFGAYQFDRVGYCLVPFSAGAMEHATNISYMQAMANGNTAFENVMAHELSHHWFGDLVTCDNESEMWLNEGWAKYCEELFFEGMYGKENYKVNVRDNHEEVIRMAHIIDSAYWPLSGIPGSQAYSSYSIYDKGADRIHTLRGYMGDSIFFRCIRGFLQEYKFKDINSTKLRDYLVSCSGLKSINDFFADWIFDGGFPDFSIDQSRIRPSGAGYEVALLIHQRSDHTSHYFTNVPLEIALFDQAGTKTVVTANVSGECTPYKTTVPFYPVYIALDFDEKISDAVTDQWYSMIGTNRQYDFGVAKMSVNLIRSTDTSLLRVEHHWVAPDRSMNPLPGLHLSDYRYWSVDGIWSSDFQAAAILYYDGSSGEQGYMDNTFITNKEDSLALLYRPDAEGYWQVDSTAAIHTAGNANDRIGTVRIKNLQKGQYALAIYDINKVDLPQAGSACVSPYTADIAHRAGGFSAYLDPQNAQELKVEIDGQGTYKKCIMINMIGETVMDRPLRDGQMKFTVLMNGLPRGSYMLTMIDMDNKRTSKRIQKIN